MTKRCGYYIKDNKIIQKEVLIDWDLGFDRPAKQEYIKRIINALGNEVGRACDVTTASPIYDTKMLSPYFIPMRNSTKTVEDFYRENIKPANGYVPGLLELAYMGSLTEEHMATIMEYDCFIDVFHNPDNRRGCTQALGCIIFKWIVANKMEHLVESEEGFLNWYQNEMPFVIEEA